MHFHLRIFQSGDGESLVADALSGLSDVLVRLVILKLDKVIKQTRPRLSVVVGAEVVADRLHKVQKHVPRITGDAPDVRVRIKEQQPLVQDVRLIL